MPRRRSTAAAVALAASCALGATSLSASTANAISGGEGVTIAVIGTASAASLRSMVPGCAVVSVEIHDEARSRRRTEIERAEDVALARAIDDSLASGARILLIAKARAGRLPRSAVAIARASEHVLIIAPAGDEGLSHERFPASEPGVMGVAAIGSRGSLSASTNAGVNVRVAATAGSSFDAAVRVAAAAAIALSFDSSLSPLEVRRALEAGEPVSRLSPRGAEAARLDLSAFLERLRPRSRDVVVRDAWLAPRHVPRGQPARVRARLAAVGRLPAAGHATFSLGSGREARVSYGPLRPGEEVEVAADLVPLPTGTPGVVRTPDHGSLAAIPLTATVHAGGSWAALACDVVPPHERPPGLAIARVVAARGLAFEVLIQNQAVLPEDDAAVVVRGPGGGVLGESAVPTLAPGERARIEVSGAFESANDEGLDVAIEAVRRPPGFCETVEDRWILRVDARGARRPRSGARR